MKANHQVTTITILKQPITIKCPSEAVSMLHNNARYLETKMLAFAEGHPLASGEEIAVIAALNIIQDLSKQNAQLEDHIQNLNRRLEKIQGDVAVTQQSEMAL